mmetsp:Transcript_29190/g.56417  ORF Transcript_29190/g.56417 Transcript_29190/m.56417 type:complete len:222 (-) Transcript_29190:6839-7504(-)
MFGAHLRAAPACAPHPCLVDHLPRLEVVYVVGLPCGGETRRVAKGRSGAAVLGGLRGVSFGKLVSHPFGELVSIAGRALERDACDHCPFGQFGLAVGKVHIVGRQRDLGAVPQDGLGGDEHIRRVAAVAARIHPHRAADGAGDGAQECEVYARRGGCAGHPRIEGGGPCGDLQPVDFNLAEGARRQADDDGPQAPVPHNQVRADAHGKDGDACAERLEKIA